MALPVAVGLTLCFAGCGGYALARLRSAGGPCARRRYVSHVVMAAAMIVMAWVPVPAVMAVAGAVVFAALAVVFVAEIPGSDRRGARWAAGHHALMAIVMALMFATMARPGAGATAGHHHGGAAAQLGPLAGMLLIGVLLLVPAGVLWLETRHRDRWFEGIASLGMALGATAMAVAH